MSPKLQTKQRQLKGYRGYITHSVIVNLMKNRPDLSQEFQQYLFQRQNEQMTINLFQCLITNSSMSIS